MTKDGDSSPRTSNMTCTTPEFRMSVLLVKGENSGSQKDIHNRSPVTRSKSGNHSRDKTNLKTRDTLRLVNEKQSALAYDVIYFSLSYFYK